MSMSLGAGACESAPRLWRSAWASIWRAWTQWCMPRCRAAWKSMCSRWVSLFFNGLPCSTAITRAARAEQQLVSRRWAALAATAPRHAALHSWTMPTWCACALWPLEACWICPLCAAFLALCSRPLQITLPQSRPQSGRLASAKRAAAVTMAAALPVSTRLTQARLRSRPARQQEQQQGPTRRHRAPTAGGGLGCCPRARWRLSWTCGRRAWRRC